jgi:N6-adenosine-specific RNA methylase IME4
MMAETRLAVIQSERYSMPVLALPGQVTETGLTLPESMSFEQWQEVGAQLQKAERSLMWWVGDWLLYGERKWGIRYEAAMEATGKAYQTLRHAQVVAKRFDLCRRRHNLPFSFHAEVAGVPAQQADELLALAEREDWTRKDLRNAVRQRRNTEKLLGAENPGDTTCTTSDLFRLVENGYRFGCIYADPPWQYDNQATRASTGNHYSGMTVDELCALPVSQIAADDAHLHLWTTNAFLFDCQRIMEAWGFEYRSTFIWAKPQMGIGNYWRNSHEMMLTGVRGDAKRFNDHSMKSWVIADRGAHSAKPEQVRQMIERASNGPYLEMFARRITTGWAAWGNQIERSMFDDAVREVAA